MRARRGKLFREAWTEVDWGHRRCCFRASRRIGSSEKMALVVRESVGVIAAVTPLNSLLNLLRRRACQRGLCTSSRVPGAVVGPTLVPNGSVATVTLAGSAAVGLELRGWLV